MRKPAHLGEPFAAQWEDARMAEDYPCRAPYPAGAFPLLAGLLDTPGAVLDLGCGTGDLARGLAPHVARVDAVDRSAAMVARGRALPGGDRVRWIVGRAEEALLDPPYALVTAGESIHWLPLDALLPRLSGHRLALVEREHRLPWREELSRTCARFSANTGFRPYDPFAEVTAHPLFRVEGEARTAPAAVVQPAARYVASLHSRNGLGRRALGPERAAAFGAAVRALVGDVARYEVAALVRWGRVG